MLFSLFRAFFIPQDDSLDDLHDGGGADEDGYFGGR
jgi:hypothetical protein